MKRAACASIAIFAFGGCGTTSIKGEEDAAPPPEQKEASPEFADVTQPPREAPKFCTGWLQAYERFIVELPDQGVGPSASEICAAPDPTLSSGSARVILDQYSPQLEKAAGYVVMPKPLIPLIRGSTNISVSGDATFLVAYKISTQTGFKFDATWPVPPDHERMFNPIKMVVTVSFAIECADKSLHQVAAKTNIVLCRDATREWWASSGDACSVCYQWLD